MNVETESEQLRFEDTPITTRYEKWTWVRYVRRKTSNIWTREVTVATKDINERQSTKNNTER